ALNPKNPPPASWAPVSFCASVQTPADLVYRNAAPTMPESLSAPMRTVFPLPEMATELPTSAPLLASLGTSFVPCWLQVVPERVNTQAAPPIGVLLSVLSPITAVLLSAEIA